MPGNITSWRLSSSSRAAGPALNETRSFARWHSARAISRFDAAVWARCSMMLSEPELTRPTSARFRHARLSHTKGGENSDSRPRLGLCGPRGPVARSGHADREDRRRASGSRPAPLRPVKPPCSWCNSSRTSTVKLPNRFAAASTSDTRAAAARYLDPGKVRTVIVGDWAVLEKPLAASAGARRAAHCRRRRRRAWPNKPASGAP